MIHITESKALKSDSDRSLRSYYNSLRERITKADVNITELNLEINETLEYIRAVNEMLEEFRVELLGYVEEERAFLPDAEKTELNETLDKIKEALEGNNISDIADEIENASKCLSACQSCFTATYNTCITTDANVCVFSEGVCNEGPICTECVSTQAGCKFCDSEQSTPEVCVTSDNPCGEEYTSACSSCYQSLFNTCQQEQISCNYTAGCTNCQNNVQSCNNCQNNVDSCSNCYKSTYDTCGNNQVNTCAQNHSACTNNNNVSCTTCDTCQSKDKDNYMCGLFNNITCKEGYHGATSSDPTLTCEKDYGCGKGNSCQRGFHTSDGNSGCSSNVSTNGVNCARVWSRDGNAETCKSLFSDNSTSCFGDYNASGEQTTCQRKYDGESGNCSAFFIVDDGNVGCTLGYNDFCDTCFGTSYGCSGCYDVAYCTACNTSQTTCTSCVKGQTTCTSCVNGEAGTQEDVCDNCYGGCQASWDQQKDCFTGDYGTLPACTMCNVGCQGCQECENCEGYCHNNQCGTSNCGTANCGNCGSSQCGSSNCGRSECGSSNCGSSQCGTANCGNCGSPQCGSSNCGSSQSTCSNCDDVSACVCSHVGSYSTPCGFVLYV